MENENLLAQFKFNGIYCNPRIDTELYKSYESSTDFIFSRNFYSCEENKEVFVKEILFDQEPIDFVRKEYCTKEQVKRYAYICLKEYTFFSDGAKILAKKVDDIPEEFDVKIILTDESSNSQTLCYHFLKTKVKGHVKLFTDYI